ncbi:hypothetical protein RhiJN_12514 [Ceratobasidium sp. AG-Ba]|nr:hypothetical protein RhiJN_12514 [Ceratobasidium sp. AG-Ba]
MSDQPFALTRDQIEFDSPNYFTSCFLGEFVESQTRTLTLSRDPDLFKIVIDYLNGYEVLPLHESVLPKRMSSEVALRNLLVDAQFYGLDGLITQVNAMVAQASAPSSTQYVLISAEMEFDGPTKIGLPVPTSEEAIRELRQKHEMDTEMARNWHEHVSNIQHSFNLANISVASYTAEALWEESVEGGYVYNYALKLMIVK